MSVTMGELLAEARRLLQEASIETAFLDAELICCFSRGCSRAELWAYPEAVVSPDVVERCRALVKRRAGREPLAYILGQKEFWSMEFRVTPAVFIPRPETETLVVVALDHLPPDVEGTLLEVGTGSGCVSISIASERPGLRVVTTDVSLEALSVARQNISRHGMDGRILCVACDVAGAFGPGMDVLGLVSNPPYVAQTAFESVDEEVLYEPSEALDGGPSGLEFIGRLLEQATEVLAPGAFLAMEVGPEQVAKVGMMLADGPWDHIESVEDLQGIPRVVIADRMED